MSVLRASVNLDAPPYIRNVNQPAQISSLKSKQLKLVLPTPHLAAGALYGLPPCAAQLSPPPRPQSAPELLLMLHALSHSRLQKRSSEPASTASSDAPAPSTPLKQLMQWRTSGLPSS